MRLIAAALISAGMIVLQQPPPQAPTTKTFSPAYDRYLTGSPVDVSPATKGGLLIEGGGTDVPEAFKWLIARGFLKLSHMAGLITDSHFVERDRLGRTLVFLARIVEEGWAAPARAIAIDRETAVLVGSERCAILRGRDTTSMRP